MITLIGGFPLIPAPSELHVPASCFVCAKSGFQGHFLYHENPKYDKVVLEMHPTLGIKGEFSTMSLFPIGSSPEGRKWLSTHRMGALSKSKLTKHGVMFKATRRMQKGKYREP